MSWRQTQGIAGDWFGTPAWPMGSFGDAPLGGAMGAAIGAVWMAAQKPHVEQALRQWQADLGALPDDIDWVKFQAGVQRYLRQPVRPARADYAVLAQRGRVCVRDAGGTGPVVLIIPSMVNRGYVLDLYTGHSLVDFLRVHGLRVLLVDWGVPVESETETLETLVLERLEPLVKDLALRFGPLHVFGYCMGGLLGLPVAVRAGKDVVRTFASAAMPWDFSVTPTHGNMQAARAAMAPVKQMVPAAAIQVGFFLLDPWSPIRRVMAYGEAPVEHLAFMTALEDWLADPLPLDGAIAREMLVDWYADNRTMKGQWQVGGVTITPAHLAVPWWAAVCQRDVLVPPLSALAAVAQGKHVAVHMADVGHVGLVCGRRAQQQLYEPLVAWLKTHDT